MSMSLEDITATLTSKFEVKCSVFLENLEHQPSSTLYKSLKEHQQDVYSNNCRFVFFNFSPLQQSTLDHVISVIDYLDISRYFVLLISNQSGTIDYFKQLAEPIQINPVDFKITAPLIATKTDPLFNTSNTMCAHAWTGLHIRPDRKVMLCCDFNDVINDDNGESFDIRTHTIDQILSSNHIKNLKNTFRQGDTPKACHACVKIESNGGDSRRALTKYKLQNIYGRIDWESDNYKDSLGYVGGHLGNLCNLKCRTCSPFNSSVIASEELAQTPVENVSTHPIYKLSKNNNWVKNNKNFWTELKKHTPQAANFEFLGGEPLLLKENLEFMQYLVDHGHSKNSNFEFTTNGTQYPKIFDQIDQFGRFTITISIDNINNRFELERSGASWSTVEKNLEKFVLLKNKSNVLNIGVSITVNIQNVLYLPELIEWLNTKNIDHYFYNILENPSYLSINQLTPIAKNLVSQKLSTAKLPEVDLQKLNYVLHCVKNSNTSNGLEFCEYMRSKDKIRKENFAISHLEIAQAMGYVL